MGVGPGLGVLCHLLQRGAARFDPLCQSVLFPGNVPCLQRLREHAVLHGASGTAQPARKTVHAANVRDEHVLKVRGLPPQLAVKVVATRREPALLHNDEHAQECLPRVTGKLIRVPTKVRLSSIAVDGPEHAVGRRHAQVVFIVVAGQRGVVRLDVDLELSIETIGLEKANHRLCIVIVLMCRGFPGLRFDQELLCAPYLLLVVRSHFQKSGHVVQFCAHVGVQGCHEALTAAPEDVILGTELQAKVNCFLCLGARVGENVKARRGGGSVSVTRVAETVLGHPQTLHTCSLLPLEHLVRDDVQVFFELSQ
mmetsp:Transcript_64983/g.171937  ORF Transcript_64983/g.171937 Transcript_64983/m.171937 type:complete len:310 (-) Transcript_64983:408-1337(-)